MTCLTVEGQNLESITNLLSVDSLEELRLIRCNLRDVPHHLLQKLPRLRILDLRQNLLTSMTQVGVPDKMRLITVCLAFNLFTAVPHSLCRVSSLTDLDFSYNRVSSLPSELHHLSNLVHLSLEGNALNTPFASLAPALIRGVLGSIEVVARLPNLRVLNLSKNRISDLPAALAELKNLVELDVSQNRLSRLRAAGAQMQVFDASHNLLGRIMPPEVMEMKSLTKLVLCNIGLIEFPGTLGALPYLKELDVSRNVIRTIDTSSIIGLHSLLMLDVSRNQLTSADFVSGLRCIQSLHLGRNSELGKLPNEFGGLLSLRMVDLAFCGLRELPSSFSALANLEEVDLSGNVELERLASYWNVASFPRLSVLLLEGCSVAATQLHFSFSTLSSLRVLSLLGMIVDPHNLVIYDPSRFVMREILDVAFNVRHPLLLLAVFGLASREEYREGGILSDQGVELLLSLCQMGELVNGIRQPIVHKVWPPSSDSMLIEPDDTARYFALRTLTSLTHKMDANGPRWQVYMHGAPSILMGVINRHPDVRYKLLCIRLLGNLALHRTVKSQIFYQKSEIVTYLQDLAKTSHSDSIKRFCNRTFAIFGICQHFHSGLAVAPLGRHKGVRILSLDGGGTRSLVTLSVLMELRKLTGKKITDMFDLVVGTSAGGMIALALLVGKTLEEMADMYMNRGHLCFSPEDEVTAPPQDSSSSWSKTIRPMINLATRGSMYRAKTYEKELQRFFGSTTMISTAEDPRLPKVAVVSCLTSVKPAVPYLSRNYDYPADRAGRYEGDVSWKLWEVARATSAAPSFFDPVERDGLQLMDGGIVANNPSAIAYHEYLRIWGRSVPVSLFLSIGTGLPTSTKVPNERGMMETFEQLVNAALSQERVHEMMTDLLPEECPYFRVQPVGPAFASRLDEIRRSELEKLQTAASAWIESNHGPLDEMATILNERADPGDEPVIWQDEYSESTDDIRLLHDVSSSEDDEDVLRVFSIESRRGERGSKLNRLSSSSPSSSSVVPRYL